MVVVNTGLEIFARERRNLWAGRSIGLLCHPASIDASLRHAVEVLRGAGARIERLFGPEHGIRGDAQDMKEVGDTVDPQTGLPVVSLYGSTFESLTPSGDSLSGLDALVVDLQDVGSRYYTYVWTMALAMQAAAKVGLQVIVLDRPNPLGGALIEGGAVEPRFESFVGLASVPNRHGLTIGEMALMVAAGMPWGAARFAQPLDLELEVIPMTGWRRSMAFEETGLPWVLPSPNMPTVDTAWVYPGQCLLEGTTASEGRGTTRPFEIFGAPGILGEELAETLRAESLPGVGFRPLGFTPTFQKHAGSLCGGVQMHVTDRRAFLPYLTSVAVLRALWSRFPLQIGWRKDAYEFVADRLAIDLLAGSEQLRRAIESGADLREIQMQWVEQQRTFEEQRTPHLLYA